MVVAVLANYTLKQELESKAQTADVEFLWPADIRSLGAIEASAYFDLLFEPDEERVTKLKTLLPRPVFVNSVSHTCKQLNADFIRVNGWPGMLGRDNLELATEDGTVSSSISELFRVLGWKFQMVPDVAGMITPRIVSMIINEAWFAFHEGISTKEEIDTAMKLGTNYPYGPFEWGEKIGLNRVKVLLNALREEDDRYTIAEPLNF